MGVALYRKNSTPLSLFKTKPSFGLKKQHQKGLCEIILRAKPCGDLCCLESGIR